MLDARHLYPDYLDLRAAAGAGLGAGLGGGLAGGLAGGLGGPDPLRLGPRGLGGPPRGPHPPPHGPPPPPPPHGPGRGREDPGDHPVNLYGMTMVERYLYSLPEYRTEMQRSNFIEIYSYNGLLATRKVIEFDGDTVLCRVCGDKASGFHYGVHACEGCKGFFRRSIQQKIQYRPCLKNQQCNIMRVNRNRCQYCRLKKCIAVGMSRDAVRFGRVPKKEKAKIMEQMHKVNSQSQVTLLNTILENGSDITQKVVEAHLRTCEFTRAKLRAFLDKAWQTPQFVSCPAHMACPLNPSPETSDGTKKWDEFSECFTPAIRNVVNFAKCIPGFQLLSQEDQVTLLKAGTFEVLLVHLACLFDAQTNTMCFANGKLYKRVSLTVTNSAGFLLDSMFDFAERLNTMQLSDEEVALFSAIVIIAADRPGLRNVEQVERVQNRITQALQTLMSSKHPDDPALFAKLLMKIPDLRTLNTLHSEKLLGLTVPAGSGKNGTSGDKARSHIDSQPAYFPGSMMPGGFPMFGGPVMPGHMRDSSMQYAGHPPDVSTIMPHQMALESPHQNHNVVLQTPLGTFHRYNSALQQHLSMNRPHDYPPPPPPQHQPHAGQSHGQCPRREGAREKDDCIDVKPRDFHSVPKFKIEEGAGPPNQLSSPGDQQQQHREHPLREDTRDGAGSRAGSPLTRDSISVATSDSGSPKSDIFPAPPPQVAAPAWSGMPRHQTLERLPEHHPGSSSGSSALSEQERSKKHRLSEEDELMIAKMQKFWNESGGSSCPVGGSYHPGLSGAMTPSLPMSVLQNPSLMSAYRKEAMAQYQQQQQQQYQHHKQFQPNHHASLRPRFHPDRMPMDNHRHFQVSSRPGQPEPRSEEQHSLDGSPGSMRGDATGLNLPELKNALSRPPLSSPGWSGEHGRSETDSDNFQDDSKYTGDKEGDAKRGASPLDPYFLNKKLKMKRRCSNETVNSESSLADRESAMSPQQKSPGSLSYLHTDAPDHQTPLESHLHRYPSSDQERKSDVSQDDRHHLDAGADFHSSDLQKEVRKDGGQERLHIDPVGRDRHAPHSQTDPPVLLRSPQFFGETESRDCRNSPPMLVPETEPADQAGQSLCRPQSPHRVAKPQHSDPNRHGLVGDNKDSKARHLAAYENNNNKYYHHPDVAKSSDGPMDAQQKTPNKPGMGSGSSHAMTNGVCSSSPYLGAGGVAPHPAYLPLPFPSVHPAIMYQYNQFAAAQMAQLQQIQLAQAQMALHHQVAMSKAESHYQGAARGKDTTSHGVPQRGPSEGQRDDLKMCPASSEPVREGRPLNLSKPQDMMETNQQAIFVKPEPL